MSRDEVAPDDDRDSWFAAFIRWMRHPMRASAMGVSAICLLADVALEPGLVSAALAAVAGVFVGQLLGKSRLRLPWILGGLAALALVCVGIAAFFVNVEGLVESLGTGGALETGAILRYGAVAFAITAGTRAWAVRSPTLLGLELAAVIASIAVVLAGHRHGVLARPLWLSDFAWRRGLDPSDVLLSVGVAAALVVVSLLLLERKGRLSLAALPLVPVVALLAVSCLGVNPVGPDRGETMGPDVDSLGDDPLPTENGHNGPNGTGGDGGSSGRGDGGGPQNRGDGGGSGQQDGGTGGGGDGGDGGGGGGDGGDGSAGGGGDGSSGGGGGDGSTEGGAGGGGGDASTEGGAGGGGGDGGGGGGGSSGDASSPWDNWDASLGDEDIPPPQEGGGQGQGGGGVSSEPRFDAPTPGNARPIAIVLFETDYSPPSEVYYFRTQAWSEHAGTRLVPTTAAGADEDVASRFPAGRLRVEAPPEGDGRVNTPYRIVLLVSQDRPLALEGPVWFRDAPNPNPQRFVRAYDALSRPQSADYLHLFGHHAGNPEWSDELRALYTTPHPDPRWEAFARETIATLPPRRREDPFAQALAIKLRMDELLTYHSTERHADSPDPSVDFFFGNRIGYCVHFAHAAVYLWRSIGIPARIGVGYMAPEENRRGGSALAIKGGDAHAWPELYLEGLGWIVLDIHAHENLDPPTPGQDEDLQRLLGEMARQEPPDPQDEARPTISRETRRQLWKITWVSFLALLLAIVIALYAIKAWRRLAPFFATVEALPRVGYRALLDHLSEVGWYRRHGETREAFAKRAAKVSPSFARATELHLKARLAADADGGDKRQWAELSRNVRRELRTTTKWWERWDGILHPLA